MFTPPVPYKIQKIKSKSINAANTSGKCDLQKNPDGSFVHKLSNIQVGEIFELANIDGPGIIRHIWMTFSNRTPENLRGYIIRIFWDGLENPSVESPIGDFFGLMHGRVGHYSTPYLGVSEGKGFNCFFPMPFSKKCRITIENDSTNVLDSLYFQINYTLGDEITSDDGRFHALFRRSIPPKGKNHVLLDANGTPGIYMGCAIGAIPLGDKTWREGELQFYIDEAKYSPTFISTGWSDWFLSAWGIGLKQSIYAGSTYQVLHPEFGNKYFCSCYRIHVLDPIYFQNNLRIEQSQRGLENGIYFDRSDDWSSIVFWYQKLSKNPLPPLPERSVRCAGIEIQDWEFKAFERMKSGIDCIDDV